MENFGFVFPAASAKRKTGVVQSGVCAVFWKRVACPGSEAGEELVGREMAVECPRQPRQSESQGHAGSEGQGLRGILLGRKISS